MEAPSPPLSLSLFRSQSTLFMEFYAEHLFTFLPMTHTLTEGAVKNPDGQCIDKMGQRVGGKAGVYYCHGQGGNQGFMYTKDREMRGVSVTSMTHTFRFG